MNSEEVLKMLQLIQNVYSNFEITADKTRVWTRIFRDADKRKVIFRLEKHFEESKWSPTPAEIYSKAKQRDQELVKIEAYQQKVEEEGPIPQHLKDEMQKQIDKLTKKMTNNDT